MKVARRAKKVMGSESSARVTDVHFIDPIKHHRHQCLGGQGGDLGSELLRTEYKSGVGAVANSGDHFCI